jgi:hypothetical protein
VTEPVQAAADADGADVILLRRIERRSLWLAALASGAALAAPGGGVLVAAGVAAGALLALISYWAIKRGVGALADRLIGSAAPAISAHGSGDGDDVAPDAVQAGKSRRPRAPRGVGMFVLRHALLVGIAYVMIARLRLPPVALLGGASVIVIAAAGELLRPRSH